MSRRATIREQTLEEAAGWLVECSAGAMAAEQREAFDAWLRASPENVRAYLTLLPMWESSATLDRTRHPDATALIEEARRTSANVIPLDTAVARSATQVHRPHLYERRSATPARGFLTGAIAAVIAIALVAGGWWYANLNVYSTGLGEQRALTLTDGTVIELNAKSKIDVRFTKTQRAVSLLAGQALFRVSHDASRPFVVQSEAVRVRALGTQFDVYQKPNDTTVTVIEGRVSVDTGGGVTEPDSLATAVSNNHAASASLPQAHTGLLLAAGEQVSVRPDVPPKAVAVDVVRAIAWTQRRMIYSATPLEEVVREFNRYNARQLVLDSPEISALRVNGVFSTTDLATLLAFLREQPGIRVTESDMEIRIEHQ